MIVINDDDNYEMCRILRVHGSKPKYYHRIVGYNSRLATMQAAVLLVKLPFLLEWSKKRIEHAKVYDDAFADAPNIRQPVVKDYSTFHIYNQYTIAVPNRDKVRDKLKEAGIGCEVYYPVPFHLQECFAYLDHQPEEFPVSRKAAEEVLSIPVYPELTDAEQQEVIETVKKLVV